MASGILLLFWYVPSVHQAHSSLTGLDFAGQVMRALHRYSSDACLAFVLLHSLRIFFARRFAGARWLAWVTGLVGVGLLWVVGWLGYWLIWDERGHAVALGTAKMLDVVPIFAEPFSRSFLTDEGINTLLFFVVFFVHMLLPLVMAIALWLHITRLSRPHFLTGKVMTLWVVGVLLVASVLIPADLEGPARMLATPDAQALDLWYLAPLALTERVGGGALWAITLGGGALLFAVPWALRRRRAQPAVVDPSKCNACRKCWSDCPYQAITMVPRTDGKHFDAVALVDPSKCVGCGICAGSCDSAGIGVPVPNAEDERHRIDQWLDRESSAAERPLIAFACGESAAAGLRIDGDGRCAELPGYRVVAVPCAGWVHPLTIERAFRHGARGVLMIGCGPSECSYREGGTWTADRLAGRREPSLRSDKVDVDRVRFVQLGRSSRGALIEEARRLREAAPIRSPRRGRARAVAAAAALAALLASATVAASVAPYASPRSAGPELVVSFQHPGRAGEHCRPVSAEEKARMPVHMRRDQICERGRTAVRLRVEIDGRVAREGVHEPGGLFGDGSSVAIERIHLTPGTHRVGIALGETSDPTEWTYRDERTLEFPTRRSRHVVLFDRSEGFQWHALR